MLNFIPNTLYQYHSQKHFCFQPAGQSATGDLFINPNTYNYPPQWRLHADKGNAITFQEFTKVDMIIKVDKLQKRFPNLQML